MGAARTSTKPGFEWDDRYHGSSGVDWIYLRPFRPHLVVDRQGNGTVEDINKNFYTTFSAFANRRKDCAPDSPRVWRVVTQAGGIGGRRYRYVATEEVAREILEKWYLRRFKFVESEIK